MNRLSASVLALTALLSVSANPVFAEAAYPSKPIRIIIPFPPGSGTDSSTRFIAQELTKATGQPVIVDNKAGANGVIAAQSAAQAPPDGYTIFVTTMTTQSVNPHVYKKLPYDPVKDFVSVALMSKAPMLPGGTQ